LFLRLALAWRLQNITTEKALAINRNCNFSNQLKAKAGFEHLCYYHRAKAAVLKEFKVFI